MPIHPIVVADGQLKSLASHIGTVVQMEKAVVITDGNLVGKTDHVTDVINSFSVEGIPCGLFTMSPGEGQKAQLTVTTIMDFLIDFGINRRTPIIALGGGVVGDVAGFVAATVLRGVPFIQAPTTLLAMVDASIGGKNGINHPRGKNLIGTFYQPKAVFCDPSALRTLSYEQLINGFAESIKMGMVLSTDIFFQIESAVEMLVARDAFKLTQLIRNVSKVKLKVVEDDPLDKRDRALLNFGHTVGHAIESQSCFKIPHGQAVSYGMIAEGHMAVQRGILAKSDFERMETLLRKMGLPVKGLVFNCGKTLEQQRAMIREAMNMDKKLISGNIQFALPTGVGYGKLSDLMDDIIMAGLEYVQ